MGQKRDLTGQKFNHLTVLRESEIRKGNRVTWVCRCDCGNEILVNTSSLTSGNTKTCGCSRKKDLVGKKFGKLTVLRDSGERRHGSVLWECQCECGNITFATSEGLRVGDNTSCGCSNRARELFAEKYKINLVGKRFGKLIVLNATDQRTNKGNQMWECLCDCGNKCLVSTNHLQTGNTKSCGCLSGKSFGELKIQQILENNNIKYKSQYIFPELPNRRYDIAILNDQLIPIQLIEFDGEQHYMEVPHFKTSLEEQQKIDLEKTNFAAKKKIPLIRIPYWKRDSLELNDLQLPQEVLE